MLLDVLKFVIEADGGTAESDIGKVDRKADDLEKSLKGVDATSKKTSMSLATMAKAAVGSFLSWQALSGAISAVTGQASQINELGNAADRIGESVENVDAFGRAIESIGGDAGSAIQTMEALSATTTAMLRGLDTESGKTFGFLGVSLKDAAGNVKGTTDLMLELSDAVQGMNTADATFHLNKLGIGDPKTIEAMIRGRSEIERLIGIQKQNGTVTKEQVESSRRFNESMGTLKTAVSAAGQSFVNGMMPYVQAGIDVLTRLVGWVKDNQTLVTGFFIAVGAAVAAYFLPPMITAAGAVLVAIAPILLMAAAVGAIGVAFALAYEDVMMFLSGGESLIGKVFDKFPAFKDVVFGLVDAFKAVGSAIGEFFSDPLQGVIKMIDWVKEKAAGLLSDLRGAFSWIPGIDVPEVEISQNGTDTEVVAAVSPPVAARPMSDQAVVSQPEAVRPMSDQASAAQQMAAASASPLNSMTSNAISNTSNTRSAQLTIGEVTVNTQATDAEQVAGALGTELSEQLRGFDAYNQTAVAG